MTREIVSNTSPIISLEKLSDGFTFIRLLYDKILVPPAVLDELTDNNETHADYLQRYQIEDLIEVQSPRILLAIRSNPQLHEGEIQAISLAHNRNLPKLLEEREGRNVAKSLGMRFSGIVRQIADAFNQGLIGHIEARNKLATLLNTNRINKAVCDAILSRIG